MGVAVNTGMDKEAYDGHHNGACSLPSCVGGWLHDTVLHTIVCNIRRSKPRCRALCATALCQNRAAGPGQVRPLWTVQHTADNAGPCSTQ